jgi:hypothetical protein
VLSWPNHFPTNGDPMRNRVTIDSQAFADGIATKLRHDFAGHYNRPDIFPLHINRSVPHLYTVHGPEKPIALSGTGPNLRALSQCHGYFLREDSVSP